MKTPDDIHEVFRGVLMHLKDDLSLQSKAGDIFSKFLLLAVASYFEKRLTDAVMDFTAQVTKSENHALTNLVRNKAVERQYHQWFDWKKSKNANSFFKLFGQDFLAHMKAELSGDHESINDAIRAFMEIGRERNLLTHEDIATYRLEKTSHDVYATYKRALPFVEWFPVALAEFAGNPPLPAE